MTRGEILKNWRKSKGWGLTKAAHKLGFHYTTISQLENDKTDPTYAQMLSYIVVSKGRIKPRDFFVNYKD